MPRLLLYLTVAGALALGAACRDAAAPEPVRSDAPSAPGTPSTPQTPAQAPIDTISLNLRGPGVVVIAGDSLRLSGQVRRGTAEAPDTLAWETSDPSVATVESLERNAVLLRTLRSGSVTISTRTQSALPELSARLVLQVLARSNRASTIVVDQFSLLQVSTRDGAAFYEPKLLLRDTSVTGTASVIGLVIDAPEIGRSIFCSADHIVGASGWSAFNPPGDMNYGFFLGPGAFRRVGAPTVRVSVRLGDGLGVSLNATGTVEPTTGWTWYDGEDTGVRCQL
jgi:hypothetical protein